MDVSYATVIDQVTRQLSRTGAFLTVRGETDNTMTIGWGSVGFFWGRPVFTVAVRPQRFTYPLIQAAGAFTVSVPTDERLDPALKICGAESGRDGDKFLRAGLTKAEARDVDAPIVADCGIHFECRTKLVLPMLPDRMDAQIDQRMYPGKDYHTLFFGEILRCTRTDVSDEA